MRLLSSLLLALLPIVTLAAKKAPADRYADFSAKSYPITMNDNSFKKLVTIPRDYSSVVLLTALEARFGCQLCRDFQPEWDLVAKSWKNGDKKGETKLIYGTLDFMDGKDTFQALGLQTAPVLLFFAPTTGPYAVADPNPQRLDFGNGPQSAEQVHAWISRHLPDRPVPAFKRPYNWTKIFITSSTILISSTFLFVAWPYLVPLLQSRNVWAALSLILILLFTSGHMYNQIRKVPYVAQDGNGRVSYWAGGFSNQYGLETQIVAAMYGLLSFATISLAVKVPRISDPKVQQVAIVVWGLVIFVMYSFLLSVFRMKNGGYPFWLPPFA